MEKRKVYENTKFQPRALRAVRKLIDNQQETAEGQGRFSELQVGVSQTETWSLDSEEEFFALYTDHSIEASYHYHRGSSDVSVSFFYGKTTVRASASTRGQIEAVFNVFEDAVSDSTIPVEPVSPPKRYSKFPSYKLETNIPSCYVNKQLVQRLERYFVEELPKIAEIEGEQINRNYSVFIIDSSGTEIVRSISEYPNDRFPDTVTRVMLYLDHVSSDELYLDLFVRFAKDRPSSQIHITCTSSSPRELAHGITKGLTQRIEEAKTLGYLYHYSEAVDATLWLAIFAVLMSCPTLFTKGYVVGGIIGIFIGVLSIMYLTIAKSWNPYTAFDSQLQIRRSDMWRWLLYSFGGFVLFSTILTVLRKILLGF